MWFCLINAFQNHRAKLASRYCERNLVVVRLSHGLAVVPYYKM